MTAAIKTCIAVLLMLAAGLVVAGPPRVAVIIDDLGYALDAGRRAIALPGPVTYAVLPGAPHTAILANNAHENGKEVLLHLPLQAYPEDQAQEPGGINLDMSREEFGATFEAAFASVRHAIGVNGHRGSLLTRHPGHMKWLMEELQARDDLFFIDSYTTHKSVALQLAKESGIPAMRRDVFLDPDRLPETMAREFERMKQLAHERGRAVAIRHP